MSWLEELSDTLAAVKGLPEPIGITLGADVIFWEPYAKNVTKLDYYPKTVAEFTALAAHGEPRLIIHKEGHPRLTVKVTDRLFVNVYSADKALSDSLVVWAIRKGIPERDDRVRDEG